MMLYQKIMGRSIEEGVTQMKLISRRQKQTTHVDGQQVGAVAASNRDGLEQAGARNTHLNKQQQQQTIKTSFTIEL